MWWEISICGRVYNPAVAPSLSSFLPPPLTGTDNSAHNVLATRFPPSPHTRWSVVSQQLSNYTARRAQFKLKTGNLLVRGSQSARARVELHSENPESGSCYENIWVISSRITITSLRTLVISLLIQVRNTWKCDHGHRIEGIIIKLFVVELHYKWIHLPIRFHYNLRGLT